MIKIKSLPNFITIIRIIVSPILLFINPLTPLFFVIYIICGLSDILDGYLARKVSATSKFGATLDSIADVAFIATLLAVYIPLIKMPMGLLIWIMVIAIVRLVSLAVGFYKYHVIAFLHTYANKITGFILFCFPPLYLIVDIRIAVSIICVCASISSIEELSINLLSKNLLRDIKSIFEKV